MSEGDIPNREDVIQKVTDSMYSASVLNNSHRGDVAEALVMMALSDDWKFVGLGWHPWDLQRGSGHKRVRIQVRNLALRQIWGKTKKPTIVFGWKDNPPSYFERDNPGETIEDEGWFCDLFVFCLHLEADEEKVDQVDPSQWSFLVIPTTDLSHGQNSMVLSKARRIWEEVKWRDLSDAIDAAVSEL